MNGFISGADTVACVIAIVKGEYRWAIVLGVLALLNGAAQRMHELEREA
jgi:hypothetical protein